MKTLLISLCLTPLWVPSSRTLTPTQKIYNSQSAEISQFPFAAGILATHYATSAVNFCGGTLLTVSWVATAAHCLQSTNHSTESVVVLLGTNLIQNLENHQGIQAQGFQIHPDYEPVSLSFDLALVHLPKPVQSERQIRPVDFLAWTKRGPVDSTTLFWGIIPGGSVPTQVLYHVEVKPISNTECTESYGSFLTGGMLCAVERLSAEKCRVNTCPAPKTQKCCVRLPPEMLWNNIGGPLVEVTEKGEFILVGVLSFYNDCDPLQPLGFVRVSEVYRFITEVTGFVLVEEDSNEENGDKEEDNSKQNGGEPLLKKKIIIFTILLYLLIRA